MADLKEYVAACEKLMQCKCDLDRWQPEPATGHSHVCPINNIALRTYLEKEKGLTRDGGKS